MSNEGYGPPKADLQPYGRGIVYREKLKAPADFQTPFFIALALAIILSVPISLLFLLLL